MDGRAGNGSGVVSSVRKVWQTSRRAAVVIRCAGEWVVSGVDGAGLKDGMVCRVWVVDWRRICARRVG